jgi:hypothetical protein
VGKRLSRRLLPLIIFSLVACVGAFAAYATTKPAKKTTPICKTGQKSTKAHPCVKKTTKAKAKVTPKTTTTTKTPTTTTTTTTTPAAPAPAPAPECPAGQAIPQGGGDNDGDNAGGPSDGDGCF